MKLIPWLRFIWLVRRRYRIDPEFREYCRKFRTPTRGTK